MVTSTEPTLNPGEQRPMSFTDAAITRICLAGCGVHHTARGRWLARVVRHFEEARQPTPSALKQRAYRRRQRNDELVLHGSISRPELEHALRSIGALRDFEADDKSLQVAFWEQVVDWVIGWRDM
jgi:hypothetical protein